MMKDVLGSSLLLLRKYRDSGRNGIDAVLHGAGKVSAVYLDHLRDNYQKQTWITALSEVKYLEQVRHSNMCLAL
jgi:hypothetical protein